MTEENENKEEPKSESIGLIDKGAAVVEKLVAATAAAKIENDRAEEIAAKRALGGQTDAGTTTPQAVDPIQAEKDKINEMLKTTGLHI